MSLRTFKARPKPNLDLINKRRALPNEKEQINTPITDLTLIKEDSEELITSCKDDNVLRSDPLKSTKAPDVKICARNALMKLKARSKPSLLFSSKSNVQVSSNLKTISVDIEHNDETSDAVQSENINIRNVSAVFESIDAVSFRKQQINDDSNLTRENWIPNKQIHDNKILKNTKSIKFDARLVLLRIKFRSIFQVVFSKKLVKIIKLISNKKIWSKIREWKAVIKIIKRIHKLLLAIKRISKEILVKMINLCNGLILNVMLETKLKSNLKKFQTNFKTKIFIKSLKFLMERLTKTTNLNYKKKLKILKKDKNQGNLKKTKIESCGPNFEKRNISLEKFEAKLFSPKHKSPVGSNLKHDEMAINLRQGRDSDEACPKSVVKVCPKDILAPKETNSSKKSEPSNKSIVNFIKNRKDILIERSLMNAEYTTSYGKMHREYKRRMRAKFGNKAPDHSKLTMYDLIFYNPSTKPMSESTTKEFKNSIKSDSEKSINTDNHATLTDGPKDYEENDQDGACDPSEASVTELDQIQFERALDQNGLPVPQLKLTSDGNIIISPESLVVESTNQCDSDESRPLVVETDFTRHKVAKNKNSNKRGWKFDETLLFYKALYELGSDFSAMASRIPGRTRRCLKSKFKREEKLNGHIIDQVIGGKANLDFKKIEKELAFYQLSHDVTRFICRKKVKKITDELDLPNKRKTGSDNMTIAQIKKKPSPGAAKIKCKAKTKDNKSEIDSNSESSSIDSTIAPRKIKKKQKMNLQNYLPNYDNSEVRRTKNSSLSCTDSMNSDEEILTNNVCAKPIVVNTQIESSGIRYTKSVTINPGDIDIPVDINETIAHSNSNEEYPSSTAIIDEIIAILSNNEKPSIISENSNELI